jgi:ferredoxin
LDELATFDMDDYEDNTSAYLAARMMDLVRRSESCSGCGMCEAACQLGLPLMVITQMLAERAEMKQKIVEAFG